MIRFAIPLVAAVAVALLPTLAHAQPGTFVVADAKVKDGKFTWTTYKGVPVEKVGTREVVVGGQKVKEEYKYTVIEYVPVQEIAELKALKATDGAGKVIDADKLAELLKESAPVVMASGPIPEKHRKLFKDTTVFVELLPPAPQK